MSDTKKRTLDNFDFSPKTRRTLARLKRAKGWTKKAIVENALENYEQKQTRLKISFLKKKHI
jgi:hypothetical protein